MLYVTGPFWPMDPPYRRPVAPVTGLSDTIFNCHGCKPKFIREPTFIGGWVLLSLSLQWRHNERQGVSNHQPHDCLFNRLFRCRLKKTSRLRVTGLCAGNSPVTGDFTAQRASNAENVSIWCRHHVKQWPLCPNTHGLDQHLCSDHAYLNTSIWVYGVKLLIIQQWFSQIDAETTVEVWTQMSNHVPQKNALKLFSISSVIYHTNEIYQNRK